MRILHAAENIAGFGSTIAPFQRALGHHVDVLCYHPSAHAPTADVQYHDWLGASRAQKAQRMFRAVIELLPKYDVVHVSAGRSLLPFMFDLPIAKGLRKAVIVHFHGCDVRQVVTRHQVPTAHCYECARRPMCPVGPQSQRLTMASRFANSLICSTPDLLSAVPAARWMPFPVDLDRWRPSPGSFRTASLRVMHRPTDPLLKGTCHILAAIDSLQSSQAPIELIGTADLSSSTELRADMERSHVLVDQLYMGWYGVTAAEAMAMGRPVVAWLRPNLRNAYGAPPIIQATRHNIRSVLEGLASNPLQLAEIANSSMEYARRVHDARRIARETIDVYEESLAG